MNLLRPIAFGIFAVSMGAQAQQKSPAEKTETKVCPEPGSPEANAQLIEASMSKSLASYANSLGDRFRNPPREGGGEEKPFTVSGDSLETSVEDKWDWEIGSGMGLSGKGDRKAIGYPSDGIVDGHLFAKGKYNINEKTYVGFFGRFTNYFDNENLVQSDRTDSSAGALGLFAGGDSCLAPGIGWEAKIFQANDNALGMDQRQRGQAGFTGATKLLGLNLATSLGLYNEDVEFNNSVGGGSETIWGLYCNVSTEIPLTNKLSAIARIGGSFEEASSLNEYTWGAGLRCKKFAFGADLEGTYDRLNRDGAYSDGGDDDMININLVWKL